MNGLAIIAVVAAIIGLVVAVGLASWISKADEGNDRMKEIAGFIREGAMAFLAREYKVMVIVIAVLFLLIGFFISWITGILYVCGALLSVLAGFFGMKVATLGNVRTAYAAEESGMNKALKIAFRSGAVMGLAVTGLGLFGLGVVLCVLDLTTVVECVTGFGLGASSMALFGRVGGGIYTKAADVGADLVGKVEAGIPEDDPRNPAVIADNVGDNVGDVAGMGSDLFESYVGSIISAVTLAAVAAANSGGLFNETAAAMFPLVLSGIGIIASVIGIFMVRGKEGSNPANALNLGTYVSGIIVVIATIILSKAMLGSFNYAIAIIAGLVVGIAIGKITEVYTSGDYKSVKKIAEQSQTGSATTIISGLGVGMLSTSADPLHRCSDRCSLCNSWSLRYRTGCCRYAVHDRYDSCR